MGQILSSPLKEKALEDGGDGHVAYGLSCMQGWRINMEDAHATILDMAQVLDYKEGEDDTAEAAPTEDGAAASPANPTSDTPTADRVAFFGVYDGHGGEKAAIFTGQHLHELIKATDLYQAGRYGDALKEGFLLCDQAILQDFYMRNDDLGCAATLALITPTQVVCGNAGDLRTVMLINGFAKALSYDHKPLHEGEKARICSAGGYVDMGRVNGNLALLRGIGDFEFKKNPNLPAEEQIVTCYPDVITHEINYANDEFVILACDGIWDCLTLQNCVECVRLGISERKLLVEICEELMELCCAPTLGGLGIGCDNMLVVIVALLDYANNETLEQWYDKICARVEAQQEGDSRYGGVLAPYGELYKQMYGQFYEIGQQGARGLRGDDGGDMLVDGYYPGAGAGDDDMDDSDDPHGLAAGVANGAILLQKLLASNAITNENGVIYLDTSLAQLLLSHFGMADDADKHIEEEADDGDDNEASEPKIAPADE